jgi:signal transduction histidine kinase
VRRPGVGWWAGVGGPPRHRLFSRQLPGGGGEAVRLLHRLGRLYAAGIRTVTLPLVTVLALLAASAERLGPTLAMVALLACWSVVYVRGLLRGPARWYSVVDAGVLVLLCLSTRWTVPDDWLAAGESWVMTFVSFACVAYQVHTDALEGLAVSVAVWVALVAGSVSAAPAGSAADITFSTSWTVIAAVLARLLWIFVRRGGVTADRLTAATEQARTAQRVAEAVRADENALANALHDTAATTLLMVGIGQVRRTDRHLVAQALRDLAVLATYGESLPARLELVVLLRATANLVPLLVDLDAPGEIDLPSTVAAAVADATGEALNNVVRHAGVDHVAVRVRGDSRSVDVEIGDSGRGFRVHDVEDMGRGLRESIHGRMNAIGGRATIDSTPGSGTRVRLEWTGASVPEPT